jgi:hypothetical protein
VLLSDKITLLHHSATSPVSVSIRRGQMDGIFASCNHGHKPGIEVLSTKETGHGAP